MGKRKSYKKAFLYLLDAANAENPYCQVLLGHLYSYGLGVERNEEKGFFWYKRAADNSDAEGMHNLAMCYEFGVGVDVNKWKLIRPMSHGY